MTLKNTLALQQLDYPPGTEIVIITIPATPKDYSSILPDIPKAEDTSKWIPLYFGYGDEDYAWVKMNEAQSKKLAHAGLHQLPPMVSMKISTKTNMVTEIRFMNMPGYKSQIVPVPRPPEMMPPGETTITPDFKPTKEVRIETPSQSDNLGVLSAEERDKRCLQAMEQNTAYKNLVASEGYTVAD